MVGGNGNGETEREILRIRIAMGKWRKMGGGKLFKEKIRKGRKGWRMGGKH